MPCPRCLADPQPAHFGSRTCAFDEGGVFRTDNWNCATLILLLEESPHAYGEDEMMEWTLVTLADPEGWGGTNGWIVTNRYKRRGRTTSAIHLGDFFPPRPVTLALVEAILAARKRPT